jgi:pyruvate/2-oxoglutarate dehydrogenase complex dihydrolipoamide dehydrogenase (E3) component
MYSLVQYDVGQVALVGAGYIAVELAGMLASLGSETHLFIRGDKVSYPFQLNHNYVQANPYCP